MSAVIKSADPAMGAAVRPIPAQRARGVIEPGSPGDIKGPLEHRIDELEARITALTQEALEARAEAETAYTRGEAQGRAAGRQEAEERELERSALLADAITASRQDFAAALSETQRLAALLAKDCLDKLFGDAAANMDRVCALLRGQISLVEREQVVKVIVSAADFGEEALDRLRQTMPSRVLDIVRDPDLPTGGCKLLPRLGEIDIGLHTQWQVVGELLLHMALGDLQTC